MINETDRDKIPQPANECLPIYPLRPCEIDGFLQKCAPVATNYLLAQKFDGRAQSFVLLPGATGISGAVLGLGDDRSPIAFGSLPEKLPSYMSWRLADGDYDPEHAQLGIALGAYRFDRFKSDHNALAEINFPSPSNRTIVVAAAVCLARDLINTPANYLGPIELADAGAKMAAQFDATIECISGAALNHGYPAIAAVGAGSARSSRLLRFSWGKNPAYPLISLCGKGVCFDTGGYDIKPSSAMLRMKKDMGGAAITLGVAQAIMALDLPVRLEVRIGCVENSISGTAMRPLDVLSTRAGLTVEVGNTDAEGRLVLADLLADASASKPDWLIDFATLTGAARAALGPDLPALFSNRDKLADALLKAGNLAHDPLWRMPLWHDYMSWLDSGIADLSTVGSRPFAGAIVAALFLRRFVPDSVAWAHIDTYAWNDSACPGRPEGGEAQALRAVLSAVENMSSQTRA